MAGQGVAFALDGRVWKGLSEEVIVNWTPD